MAWRIEFSESANRDLEKIGHAERQRIIRFLDERLVALENPRLIGHGLLGPAFGGLWSYRIGSYRIIADIEDMVMTILLLKIAHRKDAYDV